MDTPQDNEVANEPVDDTPVTDETVDNASVANKTTNESIDNTPAVEESTFDDDDFLAGIDTDSEINLSVLSARTPPPVEESPPVEDLFPLEEDAPPTPKQTNYRGLLLLTILLVLIPVLGGFALWQMNNSQMQAEINRLEATMNAQAATIDTQVATRVAAAIEQAEINAPNEVPVEVVEVVVTATPLLPATNTPVPLDTPTQEATDSPAAELEPPTATPTTAPSNENISTDAVETIAVSNVPKTVKPVTVPVGETVYFQDNFDSNTRSWFTGQRTHPHARDVSEIIDGSYRKSVVSTQADVFKESSPTFTARNFVISTDATLQESNGQTGIGLTFREDANGNTYLAKFNVDGTAELMLFYNGQWQSIASQPGVELITGEPNNFAVMASDASITLYFNGQPLLTAPDDTLSGAGKVGLAVTTSAPNQMVVVDFDNLLVTDTP